PHNRDALALPFQHVQLEEFGLTLSEAAAALHFIDDSGVHVGGSAVAAAMSSLRRPWSFLGGILRIRPGSWFIGRAYPFIARHRYRLPGGTPACKI
ncbi:MAG: DCC1-like thiol-disulfide oxidoreductase family protein, partial [Actinomycetota bacterium]